MTRFLAAVPMLALVGSAALAGPNAGGTLIAHDTGLAYTSDRSDYPSGPLTPELGSVDNRIALNVRRVWKVYAAFPVSGSPRLKTLSMGAAFPATVVVLAGGLRNPSLDLEVREYGWPSVSGSGVCIAFRFTQTRLVTECYWLGGYGYGHGGLWQIAPHPTQPRTVFVDDSARSQEDRIAGLSSIGFGRPGDTRYPSVPVPGACCYGPCSCWILLPDECWNRGGSPVGGPCEPSPCGPASMGVCCIGETCRVLDECECWPSGGTFLGPVPCNPKACLVPVQQTTWGRIKASYR